MALICTFASCPLFFDCLRHRHTLTPKPRNPPPRALGIGGWEPAAVPTANVFSANAVVNITYVKNAHPDAAQWTPEPGTNCVTDPTQVGHFSVNFHNPEFASEQVQLDSWTDCDPATGSPYADGVHYRAITMPERNCDGCFLQLIFKTPPVDGLQNRDTQYFFYQCSDITVVDGLPALEATTDAAAVPAIYTALVAVLALATVFFA